MPSSGNSNRNYFIKFSSTVRATRDGAHGLSLNSISRIVPHLLWFSRDLNVIRLFRTCSSEYPPNTKRFDQTRPKGFLRSDYSYSSQAFPPSIPSLTASSFPASDHSHEGIPRCLIRAHHGTTVWPHEYRHSFSGRKNLFLGFSPECAAKAFASVNFQVANSDPYPVSGKSQSDRSWFRSLLPIFSP